VLHVVLGVRHGRKKSQRLLSKAILNLKKL
jgi:hypothetical protein